MKEWDPQAKGKIPNFLPPFCAFPLTPRSSNDHNTYTTYVL